MRHQQPPAKRQKVAPINLSINRTIHAILVFAYLTGIHICKQIKECEVISPHPVDRLIEQDTFAEMLALLEPEELLIACLRLEDLSNEQIASLLDISSKSVRSRMEQAMQRIVEALPELAPVLSGRRQPARYGRRPLERGWICPSIGSESDLLIDSPQQGTEGGESS
jgi:predicted DNA-binding protein (UPF0251 family)